MERKENSGALFKVEDEKRTSENYAHYTGACLVNGKYMSIGAWINTAKTSGKKWMSLRFEEAKPKDKKADDTNPHTYESTASAVSSEEVPF